MSEMSNTEEREDTACIEITCSVKGYQECNFTVDVGEEFFIFKNIGSKGRAVAVVEMVRFFSVEKHFLLTVTVP